MVLYNILKFYLIFINYNISYTKDQIPTINPQISIEKHQILLSKPPYI